MIVYKDMTFCMYWKNCLGRHVCGRAYTDEEKEEAEKSGLYVSFFVDRPECFKEDVDELHGNN